MIGQIDQNILFYINGFALKYWTVDKFVMLLEHNRLFKGGLLIAVYWCYWFSKKSGEEVIRCRKIILASIIGTIAGVMIGIVLANILPMRIRPMYDPSMELLIPHEVANLKDYSSFPSDTGNLCCGLAMGLFLLSRPVGCFAFLYVLVFVLMPRVYLGFHYPTDMVAGILVGTVFVRLANIQSVRDTLTDKLLFWSEKYSSTFYGLFFLITFQVGSLFLDLREIGRVGWAIIKRISVRFI